MKKILTMSIALLMSVSAFSCGKTNKSEIEPVANEPSSKEIVTTESVEQNTKEIVATEAAEQTTEEHLNIPFTGISSKEDERELALNERKRKVDYNTLIGKNGFYGIFSSFLSPQNPLGLREGTDERAYIVKPFKYAVVDETSFLTIRNAWYFPIASENGRYIGMMFADCTMPELDDIMCGGSEEFAPELNEALEKGSIAIFNDGGLNSMYGIYEDNTIITLSGDEDYKGSLTFDEVNQEVNLITPERINEKIEIDPSVYDRDYEIELTY